MDQIQRTLIKAGHKDLAQQYYTKVSRNVVRSYEDASEDVKNSLKGVTRAVKKMDTQRKHFDVLGNPFELTNLKKVKNLNDYLDEKINFYSQFLGFFNRAADEAIKKMKDAKKRIL